MTQSLRPARIQILRSLAGVLGVVAVAAATASPSRVSCSAAPPLTLLQQQLMAKSAEGEESLRRYINLTRAMYGYEWNEVQRFVHARRTAEAVCLAQAGQPAAKGDGAAIRQQ